MQQKIVSVQRRQRIVTRFVTGRRGVGVPLGGEDGQTLLRDSTKPDGTRWGPFPGDLNYQQTFNVTDTVNVAHNLAKYPAVTVIDSAGDECMGEIEHVSINSLIIRFSAPFSGRVICN